MFRLVIIWYVMKLKILPTHYESIIAFFPLSRTSDQSLERVKLSTHLL